MSTAKFISERPRSAKERNSELRKSILAWASEPTEKTLLVGGLYGERGIGKTSALHALREEAKNCLYVTGDDESDKVFDPSDVGRNGEVDFALLHYLLRSPEKEKEAFRHLAAMKDVRAQLKLTEEMAATTNGLIDARQQAWIRLQEKPAELRETLERWAGGLCGGKPDRPKRILLLVDDFDLYPEYALDILEWISWHLRSCPISVLVSADEDALIDAVDQSLSRRFKRHSNAPQLLRKLVPVAWRLVPIPPQDRTAFFIDIQEGRLSPLENWRLSDRHEFATILADTPRKLVRLHNELWVEQDTTDDHRRRHIERIGSEHFGLFRDDAWIGYGLIVTASVAIPDAKIRERFWSDPESLRGDLRLFEGEPEPGSKRAAPVSAITARRPLNTSERDVFAALAKAFKELRDRPPRVLTVEGVGAVSDWLTDDDRAELRPGSQLKVDQPRGADPETVWIEAKHRLEQAVRASRADAEGGPMVVAASLQPSLGLALGWALRRRQELTVYSAKQQKLRLRSWEEDREESWSFFAAPERADIAADMLLDARVIQGEELRIGIDIPKIVLRPPVFENNLSEEQRARAVFEIARELRRIASGVAKNIHLVLRSPTDVAIQLGFELGRYFEASPRWISIFAYHADPEAKLYKRSFDLNPILI